MCIRSHSCVSACPDTSESVSLRLVVNCIHELVFADGLKAILLVEVLGLEHVLVQELVLHDVLHDVQQHDCPNTYCFRSFWWSSVHLTRAKHSTISAHFGCS